MTSITGSAPSGQAFGFGLAINVATDYATNNGTDSFGTPVLVGLGIDNSGAIGNRHATGVMLSSAGAFSTSTSTTITSCGLLVATSTSNLIVTTQSQQDSLKGVGTDQGDDGAPLLEYPLEFYSDAGPPAFPVGLPIFGVLTNWTGTGCGTGAEGSPGSGGCTMNFAQTFEASNGSWLNTHLNDFDGDGIVDWQDHCPATVDLTGNDVNSNDDAEFLLAHTAGTWTNSSSAAPSLSDATNTPYNLVYTWHGTFPGDACDPNATTRADLSPTKGYVLTGGSIGMGQLQFSSNIGGPFGDATSAPGTSQPGLCVCPYSNILTCNMLHINCPAANDQMFPYASMPLASSWTKMTKLGSPVGTFPTFASTHQDPAFLNLVELGYSTSDIVNINWDFEKDLSGGPPYASQMIWSHVETFTPATTYVTGENALVPNLNNSYVPNTPSVVNFVSPSCEPIGSCLGFPWWQEDIFESPAISVQVPYIEMVNGGLLAFSGGGGSLYPVSGLFTQAAHTMLANAASGQVVARYADDLVSGATVGAGPYGMLMLVPGGGARVAGAILSSGSPVDAVSSTLPQGQAAAVAAVAFSSKLNTLFSLRSGAGGLSLYAQALASAFAGQAGSGTETFTISSISGDTFNNPVAMAWNGPEKALFVLDALPSGTGGQSSLRLIRLSPQGQALELWRLAPAALPAQTLLSAGPSGQVVITLTSTSDTEVLVTDGYGNPQGSFSQGATTLLSPVFYNSAGLTFALINQSSGALDTSVQPLTALSHTLCAATTLRHELGSGASAKLQFLSSQCM